MKQKSNKTKQKTKRNRLILFTFSSKSCTQTLLYTSINDCV